MAARIFRRSRNAMQSGKAREGEWVLEFESHAPRRADPLMGWSGGTDTQSQVTLTVDRFEDAKGKADRYGISYHLVPPTERKLRLHSYADNFR